MSELISIRAHYHRKMIVPDEPLELPEGAAIVVDIRKTAVESEEVASGPTEKFQTPEERVTAFQNLIKTFKNLPDLPAISLEALRRENMYADDEY